MHYIIRFHADYKIKLPGLLYDMFLTQNMFGLASKSFLSLNRPTQSINEAQAYHDPTTRTDQIMMDDQFSNINNSYQEGRDKTNRNNIQSLLTSAKETEDMSQKCENELTEENLMETSSHLINFASN